MSPDKKKEEKYSAIIEIIGAERIKQLYLLFASEKISFATLNKFLKKNEILSALKKKSSISRLAKEQGVSKMTLYRFIKKIK